MEGIVIMMQPIDIKSQSFGKGLFGYKKTDVDSYVNTVYKAYDELFTENKKLKEDYEKLQSSLEECRVKLFKFENEDNSSSSSAATETASDDDGFTEVKKDAPVDDEPVIEEVAEEKSESTSAASKFFEKANDNTVIGGDGDDDVFVGEIEDNRKPKKAMIGDGEEDEADDFEFL